MAEPEKCPDCGRPDCLTLEVISLDSVADCLQAQLAQRDERIAEAERERDEARADAVAAAGELRVDIRDAQPGSLPARLLVANAVMRRERDTARAQLAGAEEGRRVLREVVETAIDSARVIGSSAVVLPRSSIDALRDALAHPAGKGDGQ
jgi:hypothetical protein